MQSVWGSADDFTMSRRHRDRWLIRIKWRAAHRNGVVSPNGKTWIGALGLEPTPELYVQHIVEVFREVWRVLRDDGTLWLNLGDSYIGSGGAGSQYSESGIAATGVDAPSTYASAYHKPPRNVPGLKPKDLCGIPWRVAFALQADGAASPAHMTTIRRMIAAITDSYDSREEWPDRIAQEVERLEREWIDAHRGGWYLRSDIVWSKPNPMPESCTDRPTKSHEYIFLLTKKPRYYYDSEAVREPLGTAPNAQSRGNKNTPDRGPRDGGNSGLHGMAMRMRADEVSGRNLRSVWTIPTQGFKKTHFATYPEKLVATCLKAGTSSKGCCPECGTAWWRVVEKDRKATRPGENTKIKVPGGWDTAPGAHGTVHRTNRTVGEYRDVAEIGNRDPYRHVTCVRTTGWEPGCECYANYATSGLCDQDQQPHAVIPCTVLDPFVGSGTTGVVARQLGLHFTGIDASKVYLDMARRRIENPNPGPEAQDVPGQGVMF